MLYLGIDQHKRQLTVNLRGEDGSVILKRQGRKKGGKRVGEEKGSGVVFVTGSSGRAVPGQAVPGTAYIIIDRTE